MMESLIETIEYLSKSRFIRGTIKNNRITNIKFLPLGALLLERIRKEWHKNTSNVHCYPAIKVEEENQFPFIENRQYQENLLHVKNNIQNRLPFTIKSEGYQIDGEGSNGALFHFDVPRNTLLASNHFFAPSEALEKFYHIQRERKIYWMRYSSNPSRYYLSDLTAKERNGQHLQSMKIKSKFEIGDIDVEEIHCIPLAGLKLENEQELGMKDRKLENNIVPVCVRSQFILETAACALLLDSIESNRANTLAINRKLAPYQCGIFSHCDDQSAVKDLADLSTHITNVVRQAGISVLNLEKCHSQDWNAISSELSQMDGIGVPYSIIIDSHTLRSGLMKLRSRDTTLSEIIHITDVPNYLQKIFSL